MRQTADRAGEAMSNDASPVRFEVGPDHIALVTLDRPHVRNAVNAELARCLADIVFQIEADPAVRVAVLTGTGSVFCAGADLEAIAAGKADTLWTPEGGFGGFVFARRAKPWICAVNGPAIAGGLEIALSCDFIVAADDATFSVPEVKRGLIPAAGGVYRLPRALPRAVALEMLATGDGLDARRAWSLGLVNTLASPGRAVEEALALARRIASNAPLAVQESLKIARQVHDLDEPALRDLAAQSRLYLQGTDDYREGPRAFLEKRKPRWSGT